MAPINSLNFTILYIKLFDLPKNVDNCGILYPSLRSLTILAFSLGSHLIRREKLLCLFNLCILHTTYSRNNLGLPPKLILILNLLDDLKLLINPHKAKTPPANP
jgi:hypothetical protein